MLSSNEKYFSFHNFKKPLCFNNEPLNCTICNNNNDCALDKLLRLSTVEPNKNYNIYKL